MLRKALRRSRSHALLLLLGGLLSCGLELGAEPAGGEDAAPDLALDSPTGPPCLRVALDEPFESAVTVRNPTSAPLDVSGARASCSCIRIGELPESITLLPGEVAQVPFVVTSSETGMKEEAVLLLARHASGAEAFVRIPLLIVTGPPLFTEPKAVQLFGRAGEVVPGPAVLSYAEGGELGELHWEAPPGIDLLLEGVTDEPRLVGGVKRYAFRARLPDWPAGTYTTSVTFWRGEGEEEDARIHRSIVLLLAQ